jgi:hypothetical protein
VKIKNKTETKNQKKIRDFLSTAEKHVDAFNSAAMDLIMSAPITCQHSSFPEMFNRAKLRFLQEMKNIIFSGDCPEHGVDCPKPSENEKRIHAWLH